MDMFALRRYPSLFKRSAGLGQRSSSPRIRKHMQRRQYSDYEAAGILGITVEKLRSIVNQRVLNGDELPAEGALKLEQSDLLALKFLIGTATTVGSGNEL